MAPSAPPPPSASELRRQSLSGRPLTSSNARSNAFMHSRVHSSHTPFSGAGDCVGDVHADNPMQLENSHMRFFENDAPIAAVVVRLDDRNTLDARYQGFELSLCKKVVVPLEDNGPLGFIYCGS